MTARARQKSSSSQELDEAGDNPVNAIVGVLVLREGWDVQNVTAVEIARHFLAACNVVRLVAKAARSGALSRSAPPARR
jgi:hypothetical protein